ncbi:MAG: sensor histidine kinase, partial [Bacteroidales bacterium]
IKIPGNFEKVYAFADYNMIYTVFRNLMTNALKFTDTGGAVSISTHEINGRLSISISDTGIGMSKEEQRKLFSLENFHSTDGTSGEVGTGLGFIVCREFILIHGGDIEIKSEKGKGSTFTFTLPLPGK